MYNISEARYERSTVLTFGFSVLFFSSFQKRSSWGATRAKEGATVLLNRAKKVRRQGKMVRGGFALVGYFAGSSGQASLARMRSADTLGPASQVEPADTLNGSDGY